MKNPDPWLTTSRPCASPCGSGAPPCGSPGSGVPPGTSNRPGWSVGEPAKGFLSDADECARTPITDGFTASTISGKFGRPAIDCWATGYAKDERGDACDAIAPTERANAAAVAPLAAACRRWC